MGSGSRFEISLAKGLGLAIMKIVSPMHYLSIC
jgi:hypothetical protein